MCAATSSCTSTAFSAPTSGPAPRFLVQLQLIHDEPAPDLDTQVFEGETLHLEPEIIAADPDLTRPQLIFRDGEWTLDVRFTVDGGVRLDQALLDRSGRRLALIVDSSVREIVNARPQLGASRILVPLGISDADAERLEAEMRSRWP